MSSQVFDLVCVRKGNDIAVYVLSDWLSSGKTLNSDWDSCSASCECHLSASYLSALLVLSETPREFPRVWAEGQRWVCDAGKGTRTKNGPIICACFWGPVTDTHSSMDTKTHCTTEIAHYFFRQGFKAGSLFPFRSGLFVLYPRRSVGFDSLENTLSNFLFPKVR